MTDSLAGTDASPATNASLDELLRLILDVMPGATNSDLAADGDVGNEEEGVWDEIVVVAEALASSRDYERLREEFVICYAKGWPDPFKPTPQTIEAAREFQAENGGQIKRRLVSEWTEMRVLPGSS